ncbi:MAG: cytochrome c3 family protein [bacterium]
MMRGYKFAVLCILLVAFTGMAIAQITGKIEVKSIPDRFKSTNANERTSSLRTVGVSERVVLEAKATKGLLDAYASTLEEMVSATWTISGPFGAVTPTEFVAGNNKVIIWFKPNAAGEYTVTMTPTTKTGIGTAATMKVVAANYLGAGLSTATIGTIPPNCACHNLNPSVFTDWQKTNHATAVRRKLDETGGHFTASCMSCHSVGYSSDTTVVNGSYNNLVKLNNFKIPGVNHPGVYDSLVAAKPQVMALSGIQCENCHGPASEHVKSPVHGNTKLDVTYSSDVCAPCHYSSDRHPKGYSWEASGHAVSTFEGAQFQYTARGECVQCHTAQGFVDVIINGNPLPVPASGKVSYLNPEGITCQACHDPHNNKNEYQLRRKTVADACTGCHITRMSSRGLHHAHQGSMLLGADAPEMTTSKLVASVSLVSGFELPGYTYENSSHSKIEERCVACHMAPSPTYDPTYAKPDTLLNKVGGHTFNVVYKGGVAKGDTVLNYVGCKECHGVVTLEFVELTQHKTKKMLEELGKLMPKRDSAGITNIYPTDTYTYQGWTGVPSVLKRPLTTAEKAAAYNYQFVDYDLSYGVHNFKYAEGLLKSSIEQLKLSAGAAKIASPIADVPTDNGKRLQLVWNQFPAEKAAFGKVIKYVVYRQDPFPFSTSTVKNVKNYSDMLASAGSGSNQFTMAGMVWTQVAEVSAIGMAQYGVIVPTIYDSTKTKGMYWTKFMVAGLSADNATAYMSPIDSGYSVNNIVPTAPAAFVAASLRNQVSLRWDAPSPVDDDIEKYVIYRGTNANFDPATSSPIADNVKDLTYIDKLVQTGSYVYKIKAVDNAGNQSAYTTSGAVLTGVSDLEQGIPTEFALNQNYPNPFNPSTQISFALPKESQVKVTIYSINGNKIATLIDDHMTAGYKNVVWNGKDSRGNIVSSGVYLYRIEAGDFAASKKMMLMK